MKEANTLPPQLAEKIEGEEADIIVGIVCKNVETTILHVLNVVSEGLHKYFPEYKKMIVVSDGFSSDRTVELANLFCPPNEITKIVTEDIIEGGKGAGVRTVVEIAHEIEAKSVVLVDGDLLSIRPEWIREFSSPVLYGRADLIVPYYIRDKYDGVITNNLAYPFTRALYGIDIRQPLAGEFGISRDLYEVLRKHPLFPLDFGIDIFIVTCAAAEEMDVREGIFSVKIHESTTRYLEPETLIIPMFRQVTGKMFELANYYQDFWKNNRRAVNARTHRKFFAQKPIPVMVDVDKLRKYSRKEFRLNEKLIAEIIPEELMNKLRKAVESNDFDADLWAKIVYHFAVFYKNFHKSYAVLDALKGIWLSRFLSYVIETENMDLNEAEKVIYEQARVFEKNMDYLLSIW